MIYLSSTIKTTLELAKEWVASLNGKYVSEGEAVREDGFKSKYFIFQHGQFKLVCVDGGKDTISIIGDISLDKGLRDKLEKEKDKSKVDKLFKIIVGQLLCGRTVYEFIPQDAVPEIIRISQRLRILETDNSSFNRLADAIQEVVNSLVMTLIILQTSAPSMSGSESVKSSSFHNGMYR
jgi:hypothetical protein